MIAAAVPPSASGYARASPSLSAPGVVITAAAIGTMLTSCRRNRTYAAASSRPIAKVDAIQAVSSSGDPAFPNTPPTVTIAAPTSARRRVQPADRRLAAATINVRPTILDSRMPTGSIDAARNGTNAVAPAYDGHSGPAPVTVLRTRAAAATSPRAIPTWSAVLDLRGASRHHTGTAPAMRPMASDWSVRPTAADPASTKS